MNLKLSKCAVFQFLDCL